MPSDWAGLHVELLYAIAINWDARDDFRAAAVCTGWRKALLGRPDAWRNRLLGGGLRARESLSPEAVLQHRLLIRLLAAAQPTTFEAGCVTVHQL